MSIPSGADIQNLFNILVGKKKEWVYVGPRCCSNVDDYCPECHGGYILAYHDHTYTCVQDYLQKTVYIKKNDSL